jgi:quercetin dioxygenase-like cupin family protein
MEIAQYFRSGSLLSVAFIMTLSGLLAPSLCHAELPAGVVPITSEPSHHVRLENGKVRIIEALIPKGEKSLFHEHRFDGFFVFFKADGFVNEPYEGKPMSPSLQTGAVQFIPANKPYIHRVGASENHDVHVSVVELLTPANEVAKETEQRFPPFEVSLENSRGRIYRLKLGPGESTDVFARPANTAIFAITSGQVTEKLEGKPAGKWELAPGKFRWTDSSEELTIKNDGQIPVELVEIEVF